MHGQGTYTLGEGEWEGERYVGEWKDSFRHGHGTYTNGDIFIGQWLGNFRHGQGIYIHADGKETVGEWKHSELWNTVGYDPSGTFKMSYKDGVPYLP